MFYQFWEPVKGFEGLYEIDNWGHCKSVARYRKGKAGSMAKVPERLLKGKKDKDGYIEYALCKEGKLYYCRAHRLVAEAFVPNPNNYSMVNHISGNRHFNLSDNLEWVDGVKENNSMEKVHHKKTKPIIYDNKWYPSIRECGRQLSKGDTKGLRYALKKSGEYLGKEIKYAK